MPNQQYASAAELCNREELSEHSHAVGSSRVKDTMGETASDAPSFGLDEDIAHLIRRAHQRACQIVCRSGMQVWTDARKKS